MIAYRMVVVELETRTADGAPELVAELAGVPGSLAAALGGGCEHRVSLVAPSERRAKALAVEAHRLACLGQAVAR